MLSKGSDVRRVIHLVACAVAAFLTAATLSTAARADISFDPTGDRMAITDRSTTADMQPRVWLLTSGGATFAGKLLVSKIPDSSLNTWSFTGLAGIDSGIDAASWTDGTTQRQRVFFSTGGIAYMLPFDNDVQAPTVRLWSSGSGFPFTVSGTDFAALTFLDGTSRRIAVAAGATQAGNAGYICVWESGDLGATWAFTCSADRPMAATGHDIVGVVLPGSTTAEFYFRDVFGGLSRVRRTGTNAWTAHESLSVPQGIQSSIVATESQISGKIELAVIGATSSRVYTSRITPTATAPTWTTQVALPNSKVPASTPTNLGAIKYHGTDFSGAGYTRTSIFVGGNDLSLYELDTTNDTGTWATSWGGPFLSPSGLLGSVGAVTVSTGDPLRIPRVFANVGYPTFTLQEFVNLFGLWAFRDHIKLQNDSVGVGNSGIAVSETSGAADTLYGIMSGIDRNFPNAWEVRVRSSADGANTFDLTDSVLLPLTSGAYMSDPTSSAMGGVIHQSALETSFGNRCFVGDQATGGAIVYRRGTSAQAISALHTAGTNLYGVETTSTDALDHPWLTTTQDASGTTAHIVYWAYSNVSRCNNLNADNTRNAMCYWKLAPGNVESVPVKIGPLADPGGPPGTVKGANGEVYAYRAVGGWSKICTLKNAFAVGGVQAGDCTTLAGNQSPLPSGNGFVSYGPELTSWPETDTRCPLINSKKYACFEPEPLVYTAADPRTNYKVYVAYVHATAGGVGQSATSTIYYTQSSGGTSWGAWNVPVALSPTSGVYYDPTVSVDTDGTIIVTYSGITPEQTSSSGAATVYIRISTDGGSTFTPALPWSTWNVSQLKYHCERGSYFFGDFRDGRTYGNRARLLYQSGGTSSSAYGYYGHWLSRWTLAN